MRPDSRWDMTAMILMACMILVTVASHIMGSALFCPVKEEPKPPEKYDELEFVVVHRPHVTYFVDLKYFLCFATRKPDYQDLVQFHCPELLWREVANKVQKKVLKTLRPDGGRD